MPSDFQNEMWLRMYEEQTRHVRHHEPLRSQVTNFVVAISAGLLAFSAADTSISDLFVGLTIAVLNAYGALLGLKHYARSGRHAAVAAGYRSTLSDAHPFCGALLNDSRRESTAEHERRFHLLNSIRAFWLWTGLHVFLVAIGVAVAITAAAPNHQLQQTGALRAPAAESER